MMQPGDFETCVFLRVQLRPGENAAVAADIESRDPGYFLTPDGMLWLLGAMRSRGFVFGVSNDRVAFERDGYTVSVVTMLPAAFRASAVMMPETVTLPRATMEAAATALRQSMAALLVSRS